MICKLVLLDEVGCATKCPRVFRSSSFIANIGYIQSILLLHYIGLQKMVDGVPPIIFYQRMQRLLEERCPGFATRAVLETAAVYRQILLKQNNGLLDPNGNG